MAKAKLQVYRSDVAGTTVGADDVDFRGSGWEGSPADEHRTIAEVDGLDDTKVTEALAAGEQFKTLIASLPDGPEAALAAATAFNELADRFTAFEPSWLGEAASVLGLQGTGDVHLGIRLYDDDK